MAANPNQVAREVEQIKTQGPAPLALPAPPRRWRHVDITLRLLLTIFGFIYLLRETIRISTKPPKGARAIAACSYLIASSAFYFVLSLMALLFNIRKHRKFYEEFPPFDGTDAMVW